MQGGVTIKNQSQDKINILTGDGHTSFLNKLLNQRESLPKKQKNLCDYLIENYQSVGVLTIAELSEAAKVGTTTVMRLIKNLGYESYSDIKKDIYDASMHSTPSAWWHLQESFKNTDQRDHTLKESLKETETILNQTVTSSLVNEFERAIQLLLKAKRVSLLGLRSSKGLAIYIGHLLEEFYPDVQQLSHDTEFLFDRLLRFTDDDILIVIDNAPSTTIGIEATQFCHKNNKPVILVTDHLASPAASYASVNLKTKASSKQYSVLPTILLLESLVIELGRRTSETSITRLQEVSDMLREKNFTQ
ncbi:MurR/RpiR family transcriptional regulator [Priestia filamentosa]|uniref:MurR/RpiR family transcriptional regulator n=1 Tax=Priestia filamentosa TaxID=1402861 RepID=UPI003978EF01